MASAAHLSPMSLSAPPRTSRAPSAGHHNPSSNAPASVALSIGARHTQTIQHAPASRTTAAAAPLQYQQHHQQPLLLLRPHPSLPHPSPPSTAASASSVSSSSSSPMDSSAAGVPFFVAATSTSGAASGSLSTSTHSAFSFPAASAPSSAGVSSLVSSPLGSSSLSALVAANGGSANKRISFCSLPSSAASLPSSSTSSRFPVSFDEWHRLLVTSRSRVDKRAVSEVVLSWLVQEGYADVADCFEAEALLKADRPSAHIEERTAIRKLILGGDVAGAVSRCNALYPAMLDQPQHATLSFLAQQQTLIELIREQHIDRALHFARREMAPRAQHQPLLMVELEKTMSLLAFTQPANQSPYGTLLSQQRRHAVSSAFNAALLQQQQQTAQPQSSAFSQSTSTQLSSLQPAVSDLVRLMQRLHCLQPQLACTHSYPTLGVLCKPSAAITATSTAGSGGADSGVAADGVSSAVSQRSNSVVFGSPSSVLLSPVASRTPVTMPMPSRSVARHQLPSPFLLSSSAQPTVPPSPVSLSAAQPGPPLSTANLSPSLTAFSPLSSSASASSSRRSSFHTPSPFSLPSQVAPSARAAHHSSSGSGSGSGSGRRRGSSGTGSSSSSSSSSSGSSTSSSSSTSSATDNPSSSSTQQHSSRRGQSRQQLNDDEDDMVT